MTSATTQQTSTGIRVARGSSASSASTASTTPSHHGRAEAVEPPADQVERVGGRRGQPAGVEQQALGGRALDRGDPPRARAAAAPGRSRRRAAPRPSGPGSRRARPARRPRRRPGRATAASTHSTGANAAREGEQQADPPGRAPAAVGARGRRSRGRRARARAAARRRRPGRAGRRPRRRRRPGTRLQVVAPHSSTQRERAGEDDQPADDPQEPPGAPQRERHGEPRRPPRPRPTGCRRAGSRAAPSAGRTAGPGTAVPVPSGCQVSTWSRHQSPAPAGTGESPPPAIEPNAVRAATSASDHHERRERSATGLVRKRASEAGVGAEDVLVVDARSRRRSSPGARSAAAARRRSATSWAWLVAAATRSPRKSRPCR